MRPSPSATAAARLPGLFRVVRPSGSGFLVTLAGVTDSPQIHIFGLWEGAGCAVPEWAKTATFIRCDTGWGQRDKRSILDLHPAPWGKGYAITRAWRLQKWSGDNSPTAEEIASNGETVRRINSPAELAEIGIYSTPAAYEAWAAKEAAAADAAAAAAKEAEARRAAYLAKVETEKAGEAARSAAFKSDYAAMLARVADESDARAAKLAAWEAAAPEREAAAKAEEIAAAKAAAAKAAAKAAKASPAKSSAAWSDYQAEQTPAAPFGGFGGAFAGL